MAADDARDFEMKARGTKAALGRAYWAFHDTTRRAVQEQWLPWVSTSHLEAIEVLAALKSGERIAALHGQLLQSLADPTSLATTTDRVDFRRLYDEARAITFPATTAYLNQAQPLSILTRNHSLAAVDLETLEEIDRLGQTDAAFGGFVSQLVAKLGPKTRLLDVVAFSQFFEIYGEAITLKHLRGRPGLKAARVEESKAPGEGRPDFLCKLDSGETFYVEVKTLDIVDGEFRHWGLMESSAEVQDDLDRQLAAGKRIAIATGEIDPYRKLGDARGYDPMSLKLPIDTIRDKCRQAFKSSQFEMGPTFALALLDRLVLPGGRHAVAPYYYEPLHSGACVSGVLWHAAYGRIGTPVFRPCEFEGKPTLEGHLTTDGLFANPVDPFPGVGLITLATRRGRREAYGLAGVSRDVPDWSSALTEAVLETVCDAHNDDGNSRAFELSNAEAGQAG